MSETPNILPSPPPQKLWMRFGVKAAGFLIAALVVTAVQFTFLERPSPYLVSTILLVGGLYLWLFDESPLPVRRPMIVRTLAGLGFVWFAMFRAAPPAPEAQMPWQKYSPEAVAAAKAAGRPVVIDFWASWCGPCRELERETFSRKRVVEAATNFVMLKADVSNQSDPAVVQLLESRGIAAFPTVVFIGPDGRERHHLRLIGVEGPDRFLKRLEAAGMPGSSVTSGSQTNSAPAFDGIGPESLPMFFR